jgi:hypothetical protein
VILVDIHNQLDTIISSERDGHFLEAEMSVFSEDEFTEYCINGCGVERGFNQKGS